jgi:hypothetical protein
MFDASRPRHRGVVGAAVTALLLMLLTAVPAAAHQASTGAARGILAKDVRPWGLSLRDWTDIWWQWAYSEPVHDPPYTGPIANPLADPTGAACGHGQAGPVWFLAGQLDISGNPTRSCPVPLGRYILVPLINTEWDNIGVLPLLDPAGLRAAAGQAIDGVTALHLSVDGRGVPARTLFGLRVTSPVFGYTLPPQDNLAESVGLIARGYIFPAVSVGYWALLRPPSPGRHTVEFGGTVGSFSLDITYHLSVGAMEPGTAAPSATPHPRRA